MSIAIYRPYFYIIQHINSGKFYAGVKYAENANPDQFLKFNGYQTSSNVVKQIILEEGLESFSIRKIKVFETGEQALDYESRFLRRVNASFNNNFLNRSNSSLSTLNVDWEKRKQTFLTRYGVEYIFQSDQMKEKSKITFFERYGVSHNSQIPETQEKRKQTFLNLYGFEYASQVPEIKEKSKQTFLKKYGVSNAIQMPEFQEKRKTAMLRKFGVDNPSKSPEIQEKRRQNFNITNNRPTVLEIRKYRDEFKLKLGNSWFWKTQDFLDDMLAELKMTYGELQ